MNIPQLLPGLNAILDESSINLPFEKFILVEEHIPLDGSFLFYYYSSLFLKAPDTKVILICANETASHYNIVSAKLGLMFSRLADQGRLQYVEVANLLKDTDDLNAEFGDKLVEKINLLLDGSVQNQCPILLVIDSCSILLDVMGDLSKVESLITSAIDIIGNNGTVCTLVNRGMQTHQDVVGDQYCALADCLAHIAHTRFILSPIGAGFSKDVTAEMCIEQLDENCMFPQKDILHYKLGDRSIQLIAPGLSQPALVE